MAHIIYTFGGKPYLNLTNQCPCACVFCVRSLTTGWGSAHSLWHENDPTWPEIEQALEGWDFTQANEVVFCGYGEPMCAIEHLKRAAAWLKSNYPHMKLRLNTSGLGDLIHGRPTARELSGLVGSVSISLNAPNAARYHELVRSPWGEAAFDAMLCFAKDCQAHIPALNFSVVSVLTEDEIDQCREIAEGFGVPLRVRMRG